MAGSSSPYAAAVKATGGTPLTAAANNKTANRIGQADPSLLQAAGSALQTPMHLMGGILGALSMPGQAIRETILGTPSTSQFLSTHGFGGQGVGNSIVRGVGGFLGDTLLDPVTYLSGGTEGIAQDAAKQALLEHGATSLLGDAGVQAIKDSGQTVLQHALSQESIGTPLADLAHGTVGTQGYAQALQNANEIAPGWKDAMTAAGGNPASIAGGLRFNIPLSKTLTGEQQSIPLLSSDITGKITAPLGQAIKGSGAYGVVARNLNKWYTPIKDTGAFGALAKEAVKGATQDKAGSTQLVNDWLQNASDAFGTNTNGVARLQAALHAPEDLTNLGGPLSHAEAKVVTQFDQVVAPHMLTRMQDAGIPVTAREGWRPWVMTPEAQALRFGESNPIGKTYAAVNPSSSFERTLGDKTFNEAQGILTNKLNQDAIQAGRAPIAKALSDNPYEAISRSTANTNNSIFANKVSSALENAYTKAGQRGLQNTSDLKYTNTGVNEGELKRAGVSLQDARSAVQHGTTAPWMDHVSPATLDGLKQEATIAGIKSQAQIPSVVNKLMKSSGRLDELVGSQAAKETAVKDSLAKFTNLGYKLQDAKSSLADATAKHAQAIEDLKANMSGLITPDSKETIQKALTSSQKDIATHQGLIDSLTKQGVKDPAEGLIAGPGKAADAVQRRVDSYSATNQALNRQQEIVDNHSLHKTNLEAGLTAKGGEWPAPKFKTGAVPDGYSMIKDSSFGALNNHYAPTSIANEITNGLSPDKMPGVLKGYDSFLNSFRKWVTVPFPHFWAKRATGAWFVNHLGGVSELDNVNAMRLMFDKGIQDSTQIGSHTAGEWRQLLQDQQVLKTHPIDNELRSVTGRPVQETMFGIPGVSKVAGTVSKFGGDVVNRIDDVARTAAFMHGMDTLGTPTAARLFTVARHGEVGDLTKFEQGFMKRVVPFYKWLRIKTPVLLQGLAENPGKITGVTHFQDNIIGDPQKTQAAIQSGMLPSSQAEQGGVIAGGMLQPLMNLLGAKGNDTAVNLGLPLYTPSANPASELTPPLKAAMELFTNTALYPTGPEPLKMSTPVKGGVYLGLAKVLEHTPLLSGLVARTTGGELRINSKLYTILQSLPSSQVESLTESLPLVGQPTGTSALRALSPFSSTVINPTVQQGQLAGQKATLNQLIAELYRRGEGPAFKATAKTG